METLPTSVTIYVPHNSYAWPMILVFGKPEKVVCHPNTGMCE